MARFFYFVTDATTTLRLGYLLVNTSEEAHILLHKARIQHLYAIEEVPEDTRSLSTFAFEGSHPIIGDCHGTVEAASWEEGRELLSTKGHISLSILYKGSFIPLEEREEAIRITKKRLNDQTTSLQQEENKEETEQHSHRSTLLIEHFQSLLQEIKTTLADLKSDKAFYDDIRELETSLNILLEKEGFSHQELFDYTSYLLRELSFFEEHLDPSMLKSRLKEIITKIVELLSHVEEDIKKLHPYDTTTQIGDLPRHDEKKSVLFEDLGEQFLKYKEKKEFYTHEEEVFKKEREDILNKKVKNLSLSGISILFDELPYVTGLLFGFYACGFLFALFTFVYNVHITLFGVPFTDAAQFLFRQGIQLKITLVLGCIHGFAFFAKRHKHLPQYLVVGGSVCFLGIAGILLIL